MPSMRSINVNFNYINLLEEKNINTQIKFIYKIITANINQ